MCDNHECHANFNDNKKRIWLVVISAEATHIFLILVEILGYENDRYHAKGKKRREILTREM